MNELLADIKAKLQNGDYKNEEHIRLSLVARILQNLGWDIWNPKEVNTEFIVVPNEDKTRVDVALFLTPFAPAVFIEIKGVGQIQGRLQDIERQLRDYNRNNTALFTIITDGHEWRFYYSQTGGEFLKKCFETFDFVEDNLNDIEESFATFLKKSEIENENAKRKAENYLQKNQKQQTAEDCLSEARRRISEPPYPNLPDALIALVREKGFSLTTDEAARFIKEANERKPSVSFAHQTTPTPTLHKANKDRKPGLGKLGGFLGFSVVAVIRAMGAEGWEFGKLKKSSQTIKSLPPPKTPCGIQASPPGARARRGNDQGGTEGTASRSIGEALARDEEALIFRPPPAESWPNACATFAACRKANRSGAPDAASSSAICRTIPKGLNHSAQCCAPALRWVNVPNNSSTLKELNHFAIRLIKPRWGFDFYMVITRRSSFLATPGSLINPVGIFP